MTDELDPELQALEQRLRDAHASFVPRPGLKEELRPRRRGLPELPWPGLAAAAAVLLVVVGVGFLMSQHREFGTGGGAAGASRSVAPTVGATLAFGKLPGLPPMKTEMSAAAERPAWPGAAPAPNAGLVPPRTAPVYRYEPRTSADDGCTPEPAPTLDGRPVVNQFGCALRGPLDVSEYALARAPAGATLVYVQVPDGPGGYFEPAYALPDGSLITALTPDELR